MVIAGDMELKLDEIEDSTRTFESEFDNLMELLFSTLENLVKKNFLVQSYLNKFEKSTTANFEVSDDEDLEFDTYEDFVANRDKVRALAKIRAKNILDDGVDEDDEGQAEVIKEWSKILKEPLQGEFDDLIKQQLLDLNNNFKVGNKKIKKRDRRSMKKGLQKIK